MHRTARLSYRCMGGSTTLRIIPKIVHGIHVRCWSKSQNISDRTVQCAFVGHLRMLIIICSAVAIAFIMKG